MFTEGTWSIFSSFGSSSGDFPKTYNGAMRQDTSEKKVYLIERDSSAEVLLYDFDLSVGDTLKFLTTPDVPNPLDDSIVKVDSIGLITIDNTERHQYFYHVDLSDGIYTITESGSIIEGIGNIHGFIYSNLAPLSMSVEREITCVSLNGVQVFGTSPVCFQPGHFSAVPLVSDHSISVYEFQSGDQVIFHVLNSNNRKIHFSITNILGQIESTSIINATESWSIPGSELSSGLHMAIIGDGDKPISSFMFMVF